MTEADDALLERRKDEHLDICLREDVGSDVSTGLGDYRLEYDCLPEVDLETVDLTTTILGRRLSAPIIIGAMTGGTERGWVINARLARAAERLGLGMALGSQRPMIVRPDLTATYDVRAVAPGLPLLFGNVGAVQLNYGVGLPAIKRAVQAVGADALNFHMNPLQEAVQPEGDTRFAGLAERIAEAIPLLPFPCLVKEVGAGVSARAAAKLARLPLEGVEASGVGGTSWAHVETYRARGGSREQRAAATVGRRLAGFGVPTAESIRNCREAFGDRLVIASGGVRTGADIATALALGADAVAIARPLLEAAVESEDAVVERLESLIHELKTIAFLTGAASVAALRGVRVDRVDRVEGQRYPRKGRDLG